MLNGNLLVGEWINVYLWFSGRITPKEWSDKLGRTAPESFTKVDKTEEEDTQW